MRMGNLPAHQGLAGQHFDGYRVMLPIFMQHFDRVSGRAVQGALAGQAR